MWLGGLSVLGFLATDMYLPAFAAIQQDLNTSAASVSASLSLFLAGFAIGQLFWGRCRTAMVGNRFCSPGWLSSLLAVLGCCGYAMRR